MTSSQPRKETDQDLKQAAPPSQPIVYDVETLLAGNREVRLRLRNQEYRLRLTRLNKLILTK